MFATFMKQPLCSSWSPRVGLIGFGHTALAPMANVQTWLPRHQFQTTIEGQGGVE